MSDSSKWSAPPELGQLERRAWIVGGAGVVLSVVGALLNRDQFLHSYLVAWLLWVGVAFGCFAIMVLHHLSRGGWGLVIRRVLEAAAKTIPFLGVLFIPIILGLPSIYSWARPENVAGNPMMEHKAAYLNAPFFIGRAILYFALLGGLAWLLSRVSLDQDRTGNPKLFRRMQNISGPSLGLYVLVATFASVDWIMSLDPMWYSSLFGVYFLGGHGVSAFAFVIPVALWLSQREPMSKAFTQRHFHDYGKLLLAFVMLWAYFALSQLLIIWSANLAEEVTWYLDRVYGGWKYLGILLAVVHFFLPFLVLLSRNLKRDAKRLTVVALVLLGVRWIDLYWQVGPVFHHEGFTLHWLDAATVVGVGGIWFAAFLRLLGKHPLLPVNDPYLEEALPSE